MTRKPRENEARCERCGWPLAALIEDGCVKENCSMRPMPPVRAVDGGTGTFQDRVNPWMQTCFGPEISADKIERNHRFLEEGLELLQANGCTASEAHQLVDYVFDRPVGEVHQEVGGVMVTLAALCLASDQDMHGCGEIELARIWTKVDAIRAKQAAKPRYSPLPAAGDTQAMVDRKEIPISAAREIAEKFGYHQIYVIGRRIGDDGAEHVTTYGVDGANCAVAARVGNFIKHKMMGWPEHENTDTADATSWRKLRPLVKALVRRLDACKPHIDGAFAMQANRSGDYAGPSYGEELEAVRSSLLEGGP